MSSLATQIVAQWDVGLATIVARFDAVLADATARGEPLLAALTDDLGPVSRHWNPVAAALHRTTDEVSELWEAIGGALGDVEGLPEGTMWQEGYKRNATNTELEVRFERARTATMARAAVALREYATRSVDPETALRIAAPTCGAMLAEHAAIEHWAAMKTAQTQVQGYRDKRAVPLELLRYYDTVGTRYWRIRLQVEAEHDPTQRPHLEMKLAGRTKEVTSFLRRYPQWRQPG